MPLRPRLTSPLLLVVAAIVSVQLGAVIAKPAFELVPPVAMAWLRLTLGALLLLPFIRLRGQDWSAWPQLLGYCTGLTVMNWAIYESFSRIPVGIAVTIEFLGPLAIGVLFQRRRRDLLWAGLALFGVVLLGVRPAELDPVGVAFALLAATGWGAYIYFAEAIGKSGWTGVTPVFLAAAMGAVALAIPGWLGAKPGLGVGSLWVTALAVAVLSSVLPYSLELRALRHVPRGTFGILMSLEPAVAALLAWALLAETPNSIDAIAIIAVIAASMGVTRSGR